MYENMTFECCVCGKVSAPESRVEFATEAECMDCLGKAPPDSQLRWLARKIVSEADRVLAICDQARSQR